MKALRRALRRLGCVVPESAIYFIGGDARPLELGASDLSNVNEV